MNVDKAGAVVVVLTAVAVEYEAVRGGLSNLCRRRDPAGTIFEVGELPGRPGTVVAIAETGKGNKSAALAAEQAIKLFRPYAVLFTGIAGALKPDLQLGDVVVATKVHYYHGGRDGPEGFLARPEGWKASHVLEQFARELARTWSWDGQPESGTQDELPRIHFEAIAAGETVLDSRNAEVRELIHRHYNDAAAIEMESAGVADAAHRNQCPHLTIRGVSDPADGNKQSTDKAGWQAKAANNAARFALAVAGAILRANNKPWQPADPIDPPRWHALIPVLLFFLGYPVILLEALAWSQMSKGDALAVTIAVLTGGGMFYATPLLVAANALSYLLRRRTHAASIKPAPAWTQDLVDRLLNPYLVGPFFVLLVVFWYLMRTGLWPVPIYLGAVMLMAILFVREIRKEWKRERQWPRFCPLSRVSDKSVHEELRRIRREAEMELAWPQLYKVRWAVNQLVDTGAALTRRANSSRRSVLADPARWENGPLVALCYTALGLTALPGFWVVDLYRTADPLWLAVIKLVLVTATYVGLVALALELKYRYERWNALTLAYEIDVEVTKLRDEYPSLAPLAWKGDLPHEGDAGSLSEAVG